MNTKIEQLIKEGKRQEESCLFTSTSLFIWLRVARWLDRGFIALPIIFASLSTWAILQGNVVLTATFALLAGIIPAIYKALDFNLEVIEISKHAAEFKNLQDRFRQVTNLYAYDKDCIKFEKKFEALMLQLEDVRKHSITPPEWCFRKAKMKIEAGHYQFEIDNK